MRIVRYRDPSTGQSATGTLEDDRVLFASGNPFEPQGMLSGVAFGQLQEFRLLAPVVPVTVVCV